MSYSEDDLRRSVIAEFSHTKTLDHYASVVFDIGLWESERKIIEQYISQDSSILDIGCGTGRTTLALFRMGYDVLGIDITPAMIDRAQEIARKQHAAVAYEVGDATRLRFSDESFDSAIFSFNGWCQIPTRAKRFDAMCEIYRTLKKGGQFIFTSHIRNRIDRHALTWTKEWLKHVVASRMGLFNQGDLEYGDIFFSRTNPGSTGSYARKQFIHIPTLTEVTNLIHDAGFSVLLSEYRNSIAPSDARLESGNCRFFVCQK